jgi:hypothetical protein
VSEKWPRAHFFVGLGKFGRWLKRLRTKKAQKKWVFAHFYFKSGQPQTVDA